MNISTKSKDDHSDTADGVNESSSNNDKQALKCPSSLPPALWCALEKQYNSSQLRAIHAVCFTQPSSCSSSSHSVAGNKNGSTSLAESTNNPVMLLQGPPGTGKTRTVLAIVAALLAGGGSERRNIGSKVRLHVNYISYKKIRNFVSFRFFFSLLYLHRLSLLGHLCAIQRY